MARKTLNYSELIKETAAELQTLLSKKSISVRSKERLEFLLLLKTGTCLTQVAAGASVGIQSRQSQFLWALYKKEGIAAFVGNRYKGGYHSYLNSTQDAALLERLDKDDVITQRQIIAYLQDTFKVKYSAAGISYKLKRLKAKAKAKAKTGRPVNMRKDEEGDKESKKILGN